MTLPASGSEPSQPLLAASRAALVSAHDGIAGLLTQRSWQRWTLSSFLARLPISMSLLGLVLAGQAATGSLAAGARLAGFTTFCAGLIGPLRGRLLDRGEIRAALQRSCFVYCGLLVLLAVCVHFKTDVIVLYALCAAIAYSVSGIWGGFRALLVAAVSQERLRRAHFVESLMVEISYGAGPLLVTGLALLGGAIAVLAGMALIAFLAGLSLFGVVRLKPRPMTLAHILRRRKDIRLLVELAFCLGLGFGAFESNVAQRMPQYGLSPNLGGLFLLLLALGSMAGGICVSLRPIRRHRTARKASVLFTIFAMLMIPSALAPTPGTFAICLLFASLMLVPITGLGSSELEARIGVAHRAEAFSSFLAATMIGGGLGGVLNGVLVVPLGARNIPYLTIGLFGAVALTLAVRARKLDGSAANAAVPAEADQYVRSGSDPIERR
jgi:MFS family permease